MSTLELWYPSRLVVGGGDLKDSPITTEENNVHTQLFQDRRRVLDHSESVWLKGLLVLSLWRVGCLGSAVSS